MTTSTSGKAGNGALSNARVSYMQMIYIDSDDLARHTNQQAVMKTNAQTWAAFRSYRQFEVPKDQAKFLLDYYNSNGDLTDTIRLDAAGYTTITGERVKPESYYRRIDKTYWADARKDWKLDIAKVAALSTPTGDAHEP